MAVIITRQDCNLSDANAFYRLEAYNLSAFPATATTAAVLSTTRYQLLTFANSGNFKGVVLIIYSATSTGVDRSIQIDLQEGIVVTMTIATPCVVTHTSHGLPQATAVQFTTTGALATGLTANTVYYTRSVDCVDPTNQYWLYTTAAYANAGGATGRINTSGSQSGVHTVWVIRSTQTETASTIFGMSETRAYSTAGVFIHNFNNFSAAYPVTTTSNGWRLKIVQTGGTSGALYAWYGADSATFTYAAYCDTQMSFNNDDTVVFAHYCDINQSFSLGSILGTGDTVYGVAGAICNNVIDRTPANIAYLRCLTPAASYLMTIKGVVLVGDHSGFRAGTSGVPIPIANQFRILCTAPTVGTARGRFFYPCGTASTNYHLVGRASFFLFGATSSVANQRDTLSQAAIIGDNHIHTTTDLSAIWSVGDTIAIGRQNNAGQGSVTTYTISSFAGTQVNLGSNIAGYDRSIGASVINLTSTRFGIRCYSDSITVLDILCYLCFTNLRVEGVFLEGVAIQNQSTAPQAYFANDDVANIEKMTYKNCCCVCNYAINAYVLSNVVPKTLGFDIDNIVAFRTSPLYHLNTYKNTALAKSGPVSISNMYLLSSNYYCIALGSTVIYKVVWTISNIFVEGSTSTGGVLLYNIAPKSSITNLNVFGAAATSASYGGLSLWGSLVGITCTDIYLDKCVSALLFYQPCYILNCLFNNIVCGSILANTADYYITSGSLIDSIFKNCNNILTAHASSAISETIDGTMMRFVNYEDTANNDFTWAPLGIFTRTGSGLTDTTVHTSGSGKFAIRFESKTPGTFLDWIFKVPTGDISTKTIVITVWCKINSATYYAGVYQKPRLTVSYDDGVSSSYVEATNTISWQLLTIPITPATTFGEIQITLGTVTDATGSNAYVYFDDISIFYPPGVALNLGGLDLWSAAMPITPPIATSVNAADVWAVLTSTLTAPGSIGELLVDNIDAPISNIPTEVWSEPLPGAYIAGQAGYIVGTNIDMLLSDIAQAVWDVNVGALTTLNSIGLLLVTDIDMKISDIPTSSLAGIIEGTITLQEALRAILAVSVGKTTITSPGAGLATVVFRDTQDTVDRVTADMTNSARTSVVLDLT